MVAVLRLVVAAAVVVLPGAFGVALAYFAFRMVRRTLREARANGTRLAVRDLVAAMNMRALVSEAKALTAMRAAA